MKLISGSQKVINNIRMQQSKFLRDLGEAVEKTCVDISNSAKEGHAGNMAHASKRYQNQSSDLTRSITPGLEEVNFTKGVSGIVYAGKDYASLVEFGSGTSKPYPFMYPALMLAKPKFKERVARALRR